MTLVVYLHTMLQLYALLKAFIFPIKQNKSNCYLYLPTNSIFVILTHAVNASLVYDINYTLTTHLPCYH